jgi:hypothetical protein
LLENFAPALALMLLERILERKPLVAVVTGVRLPGKMAGHVAVQLLLRLGPVRAVRASEGPVAVLGDVMPLQLGVGLERGAADAALLRRRALVDLSMKSLVERKNIEMISKKTRE